MKIKLKEFLPKKILPRLLLIFFIPLILTQVLAIYFFYEKHWEKVTTRFSNIASNNITLITKDYIDNGFQSAEYLARKLNLQLNVIEYNEVIPVLNQRQPIPKKIVRTLKSRLNDNLNIFLLENYIHIIVPINNEKLKFIFPKKYLISETPMIFFLWIILSSLILSLAAFLFLRIQVRAITRLSNFSNSYGLIKGFKSEGATEIRMAGNAVIRMKRKIKNELNNKIQFLAGISHDLGTLVTRIILQLEIAKKPSDVKKIKKDVNSIQNLLNEYLIFSKKTYFEEKNAKLDVNKTLSSILNEIKAQYKKKNITFKCTENLIVYLNLNNVNRVFSNLVNNACQYANKININAKKQEDNFILSVDDDGPGVPKEIRKKIFKPFFKEDKSRNLNKTSAGLGLSIVKDIMKKTGGTIYVEDSELGGARVVTIWPNSK